MTVVNDVVHLHVKEKEHYRSQSSLLELKTNSYSLSFTVEQIIGQKNTLRE